MSSIVDRDMKTERHDLINIAVTANFFNPSHNPNPNPNVGVALGTNHR